MTILFSLSSILEPSASSRVSKAAVHAGAPRESAAIHPRMPTFP